MTINPVDLVFSGVAIIFNVVFLFTLFNPKAYVPRKTSVIYVFGLLSEAIVTFVTWNLVFTGVMCLVGTVEWLGVFLYRGKPVTGGNVDFYLGVQGFLMKHLGYTRLEALSTVMTASSNDFTEKYGVTHETVSRVLEVGKVLSDG